MNNAAKAAEIRKRLIGFPDWTEGQRYQAMMLLGQLDVNRGKSLLAPRYDHEIYRRLVDHYGAATGKIPQGAMWSKRELWDTVKTEYQRLADLGMLPKRSADDDPMKGYLLARANDARNRGLISNLLLNEITKFCLAVDNDENRVAADETFALAAVAET